jgi:hypothetical protein
MKQKLLAIVLVFLLVPQVTLAAWWNPFTWFKKTDKVPVSSIKTEITTSTSSEEAIIEAKVKERVDAALKQKEEEQRKIEAAAKAKIEEQKRIDAAVKAALEKQALEQRAKQQVDAPVQTQNVTPIHEGVNYSAQLNSKLKSSLQIEKTYRAWLGSTIEQLKSMVVTLSGYNVGGLYGQSRDASINLANAEIKVLNTLIDGVDQRIVKLEGAIDFLNKYPDEFIDKKDFDAIPSPEAIQADINNVKEKVNEVVQDVANSLKYH